MTVTVDLLFSLIGTAVAVGGFALGVVRWALSELAKRDLAIQASDARAKLAEDDLARALAAHKLYAAETFATGSELASALGKVEAAIDRLSQRLDQILARATGGVG